MFTVSIHKKESGFSLLETIVSLGIGLLVMIMVLTIFTKGLVEIRSINNKQVLISNADFIINNLDYLIKQAKIVSVPNPSTLNLQTISTTTITINGSGDIVVNGISLNTAGVKLNSLNFQKMARSVRINFELKKGGEMLSVTTTIAQRN